MLDAIASTPEVATFFLILCGVAAGALVAFFLLPSPREMRRLQAEIDRLRAEHERYKSQVTGHFHKTAELVGVMTQSYKNVYDHLAQGAQALCDGPPALTSAFGEPRLIADVSFVVGDETAGDEPKSSQPETSAAVSDEAKRAHGDEPPRDGQLGSTTTEAEGTARAGTDSRDHVAKDRSVAAGAHAAPAAAGAGDDDGDAFPAKRDWSRMEETPAARDGDARDAGDAMQEPSPSSDASAAKPRGNGADDSRDAPRPANSH